MKAKNLSKKVALASALLACGTALAGNPVAIKEEDLRSKSGWGATAGQTVVLEGSQFDNLVNGLISLVKPVTAASQVSDRLVLDETSQPDLFQKVLGWKDKNNVAIAKPSATPRSNVRITGVARDDGLKGRVIDVTEVLKVDDDDAAFAKRAQPLTQASDDKGLWALALEATAREKDYPNEKVKQWIKSCYEQALDIRKAGVKDPDAAIALAKQYKDLAGNTNKSIDFLGPFANDASIPEKKREEIRQSLDVDYAALFHRNKWMSKDDFKASLGYLQRKDPSTGKTIWVRRERAEFLDEVAKEIVLYQQDSNIRKLLDGQYGTEATKGNLVPGMAKAEVVRVKKGAATYGFAESVERFTESVPRFRSVTWDQWIMPDGGRLYFVDQMFFLEKKASDPLPAPPAPAPPK